MDIFEKCGTDVPLSHSGEEASVTLRCLSVLEQGGIAQSQRYVCYVSNSGNAGVSEFFLCLYCEREYGLPSHSSADEDASECCVCCVSTV